jgi:hypothetical protein
MFPANESPPTVPFTLQVTAVFEVFVTVAVNCAMPPSGTAALVGKTSTVTGRLGGAGGATGGEVENPPPFPAHPATANALKSSATWPAPETLFEKYLPSLRVTTPVPIATYVPTWRTPRDEVLPHANLAASELH